MAKVPVSVCIPVYNCGPYIGEAIQSVLDQTFRDFELVIVDNCSTDNTIEVIESFKDPRIRLVRNETNIGLLGNWNKAVQVCEGEYVKMLPADDFLYPDCLMKQAQVLINDKNEAIAVVSSRKNVINDAGKILMARGFSSRDRRLTGKKAINRTVRAGGNVIGEPGAVMFRKTVFDKAGPFDASIYYVIDLDMWFRMLVYGDLYSCGDVLCAFRISGLSESMKQLDTQRRDIDRFFRKILDQPKFGLTGMSYRIGLAASYASSIAKKFVYKFMV